MTRKHLRPIWERTVNQTWAAMCPQEGEEKKKTTTKRVNHIMAKRKEKKKRKKGMKSLLRILVKMMTL